MAVVVRWGIDGGIEAGAVMQAVMGSLRAQNGGGMGGRLTGMPS